MKPILYTIIVLLLVACGNDPITNAGYFDDDVDRSTTTTTAYTNDESTTSNSNNTTTNNYYHDSVIVVHDTLTRTITTRVTDTMYVKDTLTFTDTLTIHTSTTDTIVKNIREVVRDTLTDTLTITIRDTVRETKTDTIKEIITQTDTVRLLTRDTISVLMTDYFDSLQSLYDNLLSYRGKAIVADYYTITYSRSTEQYATMKVTTDRTFPTPVGGTYSVCMTYIDAMAWLPKTGNNLYQNEFVNDRGLDHKIPTDAMHLDGKYTACGTSAPYGNCVIVTKIYINTYDISKKLYSATDVWDGAVKVCYY